MGSVAATTALHPSLSQESAEKPYPLAGVSFVRRTSGGQEQTHTQGSALILIFDKCPHAWMIDKTKAREFLKGLKVKKALGTTISLTPLQAR